MRKRRKVGCKSVKIKFPLSKKEATSFWATQSYDASKIGLKKRKPVVSLEWLEKWCKEEMKLVERIRDTDRRMIGKIVLDSVLSAAKKEALK